MQQTGGDDKRNLLMLLVLSFVILWGGDYLLRWWRGEDLAAPVSAQTTQTPQTQTLGTPETQTSKAAPFDTWRDVKKILPVDEALRAGPRLSFETATLRGSFNLRGGALDDVVLKGYHEKAQTGSPWVRLLQPEQTKEAYQASWHWVLEGKERIPGMLPSANDLWQGRAEESGASGTFKGVLWWQNKEGVLFQRHITIDDKGMLHVRHSVKNTAATPLRFRVISQLRRVLPEAESNMVVHAGAIGVLGGSLKEWTYDKLKDKGAQHLTQTKGWLGLTDKFWLAAFAPSSDFDARLQVGAKGHAPVLIEAVAPVMEAAAGGTAHTMSRLYVGAKVLRVLDGYEASEKIANFDLAVDFGWFYFITKPTFYVLSWLKNSSGNLGLAILLFTVLLKMIFFPLAQRSNRSMAKMKQLAPEIERLKARLKDDKQRMGQEVMALYRKHRVNPVSGCLPMVLQLPFFFALYKVLMVSIEMRHAPFWGWIHDLSAPDPTHLLNLFGLLPFTPPNFFHIGLWPLFMGASMFLQQRLSPPTADPAQQKIFLYGMPVLFTFMFGNLAAGVVIFWTWNNFLSVAQQWYTMRSKNA